MSLLKFFKWDFGIAMAMGVVAFFYSMSHGGGAVSAGLNGLATYGILVLVEMVFSFDNAGVNAKYLKKFNPFWRKMFMTVGILVAVFGMRLVFPFVIVCISGHITPIEAIHLAMAEGDPHTPGTYGYILNTAHPSIAAFGGMFLMMLFLNFLFDHERESHWLKPIEGPLSNAGSFDSLAVLVSGLALLGATFGLAHHDERLTVLMAGFLGILTYVAVNGFATFMEGKQAKEDEFLENVNGTLAGKAAFSLFLFLEVLDASFSFDGVLGAFAITTDPVIIAMGLGVGALFVRSMTIYLVDHNSLDEIEYLEHGAHWAIGILATMLLVTLKFEIPDVVIGLAGIVVIVASIWQSLREAKHDAVHDDDHDEPAPGIFSSHPDHARHAHINEGA